jgi:hypothetical protein
MSKSWGQEMSCFTCTRCGKRAYVSRKDARRAARINHPGDQGLAAYQCPQLPDYWHYGHAQPGDRDKGRNTITTALETTGGTP